MVYLDIMARIVGPLMSLSATGTIKETLTFVCGTFARMAMSPKKKEFTEKQTGQQTKFSDGCAVWNTIRGHHLEWHLFSEWVKDTGFCDVSLSRTMTGFQVFMAYYLQNGVNGWQNYPYPPIVKPL